MPMRYSLWGIKTPFNIYRKHVKYFLKEIRYHEIEPNPSRDRGIFEGSR
jgi:hypothetical protein